MLLFYFIFKAGYAFSAKTRKLRRLKIALVHVSGGVAWIRVGGIREVALNSKVEKVFGKLLTSPLYV